MNFRKVIEMFKKNKNAVIAGGVALVLLSGITVGLVYLRKSSKLLEEEKVKEEVVLEDTEELVDTEEDVEISNYWLYVNGINDLTIQAGTDVDFMEGVEWNKDFIDNVTVDSSKVVVGKEGVYQVVYTLTSKDGVEDIKEVLVTVVGNTEGIAEEVKEENKEENKDKGIEVEKKDKKKDSSKSTTKDKESSSKSSNKKDKGNNSSSQKVKPTETTKPNTNKGSNSTQKPSTTTKPTQTVKPDTGKDSQKPSTTPKPTQKPTETVKPGTGKDSNSSQKPSTTPKPTQKPVATPEPKPTEKPTPSPKPTEKPVHNHTWVDVTETIEHPALMGKETRVVKEAWTETVPVYEDVAVEICNGCGTDITSNYVQHAKEAMLSGNSACGSRHTEYRSVQVDTRIIKHPAVTEEVTVVVKEAWTEVKVVGQKCSGCGKTK